MDLGGLAIEESLDQVLDVARLGECDVGVGLDHLRIEDLGEWAQVGVAQEVPLQVRVELLELLLRDFEL